MINKNAVKTAREHAGKTENTDTTQYKKAELAAMETCELHKTELAIAFSTALLFDPTLDDVTLSAMTTILHPQLQTEIQRLILPAIQPFTKSTPISSSLNDICLSCLRYLSASIWSDIDTARKTDGLTLKAIENAERDLHRHETETT